MAVRFRLFGLCVLVIFNYGCIDEIDYFGDPTELGINISGQFTNLQEEQIVVIREALDVSASASVVGDPIEDANVQIEDSEGSIIRLPYRNKGEYVTVAKGEEGLGYRLIVRLNDGRVFISNFEKISPSVPILKVSALLKDIDVLQNGQIVSTIPKISYNLTSRLFDGNTPVYAIYRAKGEYEFAEVQTSFGNAIEDSKVCYISESNDLGNVSTLSGFDLPNNEAVEREVFQIDYDYRFELNYALHLEQYVISETTYNYWYNVEQLVNQTSLFDPPPGRIYSNIQAIDQDNPTVVRGYFTVAGKSEMRAFTNASIEERPVENICLAAIRIGQRNNDNLPPFCVDCLLARNSTVIKPEYWPN